MSGGVIQTAARQSTTLSSGGSLALRSFEAQWHTRAPDALSEVRGEAMERFLALGMPTARDESWRYTNLRRMAGTQFIDAPPQARSHIEPSASVSLLDSNQRAATVILVNGHPWLDTMDAVINDIEINSLKEFIRIDPKAMLRFCEFIGQTEAERFDLLNSALFLDGLHLKVTTRVSTPLVILHVAIGDEGDTATVSYPRVIVEVAPGASATIIEHHVAQGERTPLVNSHTQLSLGRGAQLEHYRVFATGANATHLDSLDIRAQQDSSCKQFTIALGGGLVRANLHARLAERGASLDANALLVGHGARHLDCLNVVTHEAPDTSSRQTARAIGSDTSRVVFNSKVIVKAGAVHADSQQSCRGLLLSPTAEIDTRPQLEIHTDEVKCAHGATTGRLDPDMLFYLLSRGINRDAAQSLLVFAFLSDVLTGMSVPSARTSIENALITQLPDAQLLRSFR